MPTQEQIKARKVIAELEANPKHTKADPVAAGHTKVDRLDDPKHQGKPDPAERARWREVMPGVYEDPDAKEQDE